MPDASNSDPEEETHAAPVTDISGGVNLDVQRDITIGGDVVGRDKITTIGYTADQVQALITQISSTFQQRPFDDRCPYLGLDYFSEDDADRFFGRETLVSELVTRVKESRFVVIAGPSGSGKSSLVRAGLIHALKQGAIPNSDRWLYATLTPARDPIESLALAMSRMAKSPDAGKYVREHSTEPGALHEFAESQLSDRKDQRAVIFVDQFEEVFTQVSKEDERVAFLNLLTHAATIENGRMTVLFALRSDFVSNCATYPQLNALLNQQFLQVGAMQPDELVSAIVRPALQVGLRIDPDLVAQIVNDMQDEPGALPLMQFALKDLFEAQRARGGVIALTLNDYLARGGLRKALERHADAAFAQLSEDEQHLARIIFSGLIEIGRGTQDTRRTAAFDELVPTNNDTTQVKAIVQKLADARLITTDEQDHHETITIAHETLIDAWPWLRKLINENREAIALQNQIAEDAQEWNDKECDTSYLYTGARLATAREELAGRKIVLNELAQAYVDAGTEAEKKRLRLRNRIVAITTITVGLLAVVAMLFAFQSSQNAAIADFRAGKADLQIQWLIDFLSGRPENPTPATSEMPVMISDSLASGIFVIANLDNQVGANYIMRIEDITDIAAWIEMEQTYSLTVNNTSTSTQIGPHVVQPESQQSPTRYLIAGVPNGAPLDIKSATSSIFVFGSVGNVSATTGHGYINVNGANGSVSLTPQKGTIEYPTTVITGGKTTTMTLCGLVHTNGPYDINIEKTAAKQFGRIEVNQLITDTLFFTGTIGFNSYRFDTDVPRISIYTPAPQSVHIYTANEINQVIAGKRTFDPGCKEVLTSPNSETAIALMFPDAIPIVLDLKSDYGWIYTRYFYLKKD